MTKNINIGNKKYDYDSLVGSINKNRDDYISSHNFNKTRASLFNNAVTRMVRGLQNGTITYNELENNFTDSTGQLNNNGVDKLGNQVTDKKKSYIDANGAAAHFLVSQLPNIELYTEPAKDKFDIEKDFKTFIQNTYQGGSADHVDPNFWGESDTIRKGKVYKGGRTTFVRGILSKYLNTLVGDKYNNFDYGDTSLDQRKKAITDALGILSSGKITQSTYDAIRKIGLDPKEMFEGSSAVTPPAPPVVKDTVDTQNTEETTVTNKQTSPQVTIPSDSDLQSTVTNGLSNDPRYQYLLKTDPNAAQQYANTYRTRVYTQNAQVQKAKRQDALNYINQMDRYNRIHLAQHANDYRLSNRLYNRSSWDNYRNNMINNPSKAMSYVATINNELNNLKNRNSVDYNKLRDAVDITTRLGAKNPATKQARSQYITSVPLTGNRIGYTVNGTWNSNDNTIMMLTPYRDLIRTSLDNITDENIKNKIAVTKYQSGGELTPQQFQDEYNKQVQANQIDYSKAFKNWKPQDYAYLTSAVTSLGQLIPEPTSSLVSGLVSTGANLTGDILSDQPAGVTIGNALLGTGLAAASSGYVGKVKVLSSITPKLAKIAGPLGLSFAALGLNSSGQALKNILQGKGTPDDVTNIARGLGILAAGVKGTIQANKYLNKVKNATEVLYNGQKYALDSFRKFMLSGPKVRQGMLTNGGITIPEGIEFPTGWLERHYAVRTARPILREQNSLESLDNALKNSAWYKNKTTANVTNPEEITPATANQVAYSSKLDRAYGIIKAPEKSPTPVHTTSNTVNNYVTGEVPRDDHFQIVLDNTIENPSPVRSIKDSKVKVFPVNKQTVINYTTGTKNGFPAVFRYDENGYIQDVMYFRDPKTLALRKSDGSETVMDPTKTKALQLFFSKGNKVLHVGTSYDGKQHIFITKDGKYFVSNGDTAANLQNASETKTLTDLQTDANKYFKPYNPSSTVESSPINIGDNWGTPISSQTHFQGARMDTNVENNTPPPTQGAQESMVGGQPEGSGTQVSAGENNGTGGEQSPAGGNNNAGGKQASNRKKKSKRRSRKKHLNGGKIMFINQNGGHYEFIS